MCTVQKDFMQGRGKKTKKGSGGDDDEGMVGAIDPAFLKGKVFDRWSLYMLLTPSQCLSLSRVRASSRSRTLSLKHTHTHAHTHTHTHKRKCVHAAQHTVAKKPTHTHTQRRFFSHSRVLSLFLSFSQMRAQHSTRKHTQALVNIHKVTHAHKQIHTHTHAHTHTHK